MGPVLASSGLQIRQAPARVLTYGRREVGVGRVIGKDKGSIVGGRHSEVVGSQRWVK